MPSWNWPESLAIPTQCEQRSDLLMPLQPRHRLARCAKLNGLSVSCGEAGTSRAHNIMQRTLEDFTKLTRPFLQLRFASLDSAQQPFGHGLQSSSKLQRRDFRPALTKHMSHPGAWRCGTWETSQICCKHAKSAKSITCFVVYSITRTCHFQTLSHAYEAYNISAVVGKPTLE